MLEAGCLHTEAQWEVNHPLQTTEHLTPMSVYRRPPQDASHPLAIDVCAMQCATTSLLVQSSLPTFPWHTHINENWMPHPAKDRRQYSNPNATTTHCTEFSHRKLQEAVQAYSAEYGHVAANYRVSVCKKYITDHKAMSWSETTLRNTGRDIELMKFATIWDAV